MLIRHIDNKPIFTNEAIAIMLGFPEGVSGVERLYKLKERFPLPIHHDAGQKQVFMYRDDICHLRCQILRCKQSLADHLNISLRTLGKLLNHPEFPIYRNSREGKAYFPKTDYPHSSFFAMKDQIADWYKDYRFSTYMQTGDVKHLNRLKHDLKKIPCSVCGKPKFLIPGINVTEISPMSYWISSDLSNDSYTSQIRDKNPVCLVCKEPVHTYTCNHPLLYV